MANAKVCDRCGTFFIPERNSYQTGPFVCISYNDLINVRQQDLCPDCRESLAKWFKNKAED